MLDSAVSSSFEKFPIFIGRTLLPRNPTIIIAVIVDFAYYKSSGCIHSVVVNSLALAFVALLTVFSSCIGIYVNIIILPLILNCRIIL